LPSKGTLVIHSTVTVLILGILVAAYLVSIGPPTPVPAATPRYPATPRPLAKTATFTTVTWGTTTPQLQAAYHLEVTFTGLRGENCHLVWRPVYISDGSPADTSGTLWTGALQYDVTDWTVNLMVTAPDRARQRWGTSSGSTAPATRFWPAGDVPSRRRS